MRLRLDCDDYARDLIRIGREARALPATVGPLPVFGSPGMVGIVSPGKGVYLDVDLKRLGITKPLPNVVGRSKWRPYLEWLVGDRGAVTSMADIVTAAGTTRQHVSYSATSINQAGGTWQSLLGEERYLQTAGATARGAASPGAALNQSSPGSLVLSMTQPNTGLSRYLAAVSIQCMGTATGFGMILFTDCLVEVGNINLSAITPQTINSTALTRYTSGVGVHLSICYDNDSNATLVTSPSTISMNYVDEGGVLATSSASIATGGPDVCLTADASGKYPLMALAAGGRGIRSVTSLTSGTAMTGTATTFDVLLHKPLFACLGYSTTNYVIERDARSEPFMLVPLALGSDNQYGCITGLFLSSGAGSSTGMNFGFTFIDA